MEQTPNYALSQWDEQDRILREDFNANNAKLEQALAAQADTLAPIAAKIGKLGNCQLYTASYFGTGEDNHLLTHTFPAKPIIVIIRTTSGNYTLTFIRGCAGTYTTGADKHPSTVFWNGNSISWTATSIHGNANAYNETYHIVALLDLSAE